MSDTTTTTDSPKVAFSSTVFPTDEDMKLWDSLTPEEQLAVIAHDEEQGSRSGVAPAETLEDRLKRVRAQKAR